MGKFLPDYEAEYYLTKHRVRLSPVEMKDVFFDSYDPALGLVSPDSTVRIEAATHIGLQKVPESEQILLQALSARPQGRELYCMLWALGEVGSESAERALIEYLDDRDLEARLEAIEALAGWKSEKALPQIVRGLKRSPPPTIRYTSSLEELVRRACLDYLVTGGDESCIPALWELYGVSKESNDWIGYATPRESYDHFNRLNQEIMALTALAACGDDHARQYITEAVIAGGKATQHDYLVSTAWSKSNYNGFPGGFWTGIAVTSGLRGIHPWPSVRWAHDLFQANEGFRDELYRECSLDDQLPDAGKIVLLANLATPTDQDFERLMSIWERSILDPVSTIDVVDVYRYHKLRFRYQDSGADDLPSIRYNYNACSVAYALARHKRVEELSYVWDTAPKDDAVLKGDIVYAMAKTNESRFFPIIRDQEELEIQLAFSETERKRLSKFIIMPMDFRYRESAIQKYVFGYRQDPCFARELITDRRLPPYLRLRVLVKINYFVPDFRPLLRVAKQELHALVGEYGGDPTFDYLAERIREMFERITETLRERDETS